MYSTLIPVHSTSIRAIGYDGSTLAVLFHTSDKVYNHPSVPLVVFLALMAATSKGTFYNQHIRGRYR